MIDIKPCPFCGEAGKLRKLNHGYRTQPVTITDTWVVECPKGCCTSKSFASEIFHDRDGSLVINHNGAEEAVAAWNRRKND